MEKKEVNGGRVGGWVEIWRGCVGGGYWKYGFRWRWDLRVSWLGSWDFFNDCWEELGFWGNFNCFWWNWTSSGSRFDQNYYDLFLIMLLFIDK